MATVNYGNGRSQNKMEDREPVKKIDVKLGVKKDTASEKLFKMVVQTDFNTWKDHMIKKVIIPKAVSLVRNTIVEGVDMFFYNKVMPSAGAGFGNNTVNYNSCYNYNNQNNRFSNGPINNGTSQKFERGFDRLNHLVFPTEDSAKSFLNDVRARMMQYNNKVSLLEIEDMLQQPSDAVHYDWGWTNVTDFDETYNSNLIYAVPNGWCIKFPRLTSLR